MGPGFLGRNFVIFSLEASVGGHFKLEVRWTLAERDEGHHLWGWAQICFPRRGDEFSLEPLWGYLWKVVRYQDVLWLCAKHGPDRLPIYLPPRCFVFPSDPRSHKLIQELCKMQLAPTFKTRAPQKPHYSVTSISLQWCTLFSSFFSPDKWNGFLEI